MGQKNRTELTIENTYRGSFSDLVIVVGAMSLLLVPLAWPSLKTLFNL